MKKVEILNFQNFYIKNTNINNLTLKQIISDENDTLKIIVIRDPYDYFYFLLDKYLTQKRSILFSEDMIINKKNMSHEDFIKWLKTLTFIPFYNPQTFQLDPSKRLSVAIETLECFDYVIPYEEIDLFLENVSLNITIEKGTKVGFPSVSKIPYESLNVFIDKDLKLYKRSLELWHLVKENNFKPLSFLIERKKRLESKRTLKQKLDLNKYRGMVGQINSHSISGWTFHEEKEDSLMVEIYRNNNLLCTIKADKLREDLKKRQIHPTGQCGFKVVFENSTFKHDDYIEIKVLPDMINLPFGKNVENFLRGDT